MARGRPCANELRKWNSSGGLTVKARSFPGTLIHRASGRSGTGARPTQRGTAPPALRRRAPVPGAPATPEDRQPRLLLLDPPWSCEFLFYFFLFFLSILLLNELVSWLDDSTSSLAVNFSPRSFPLTTAGESARCFEASREVACAWPCAQECARGSLRRPGVRRAAPRCGAASEGPLHLLRLLGDPGCCRVPVVTRPARGRRRRRIGSLPPWSGADSRSPCRQRLASAECVSARVRLGGCSTPTKPQDQPQT